MSKDMPMFEVPPEMRQFAEKSVEQAKQAFDGFIAAARQAATSADAQAMGARTGTKEVGDLAMRYAERNIASSFEFAQKLVRAKDPQEIMALNAEFVRSQMSVLTDQAKELGQQAAKMGTGHKEV